VPVSTVESTGLGSVKKLRAGERGPLMNPKMLLPVLIALHWVAAALIIDGLGDEEQESGRRDRAWQVVEWDPGPGCMVWYANDEFARHGSSEYRPLNAMDTDWRGCVNIH
jgi:hypothetical protein